jgi:hypothetical protein
MSSVNFIAYVIMAPHSSQIMKKFLFILFLLSNYLSNGQNLVRNSSFEEFTTCPNALGQIDYCLYWTSFGGTVDYFHSCSTIPGFAPPNTLPGYQTPHSGSGFALLAGWASFPGYREIIGNSLSVPLTIGQKYFFSFFVNYTFYIPSSTVASNNLGLRFSTNLFSELNPTPINNYSVFHTDSIISDTVSWIKLSGFFIADSAYNYVMIGNFYQNNNTDTIHLSNDFPDGSLYFLDDVCISTDSVYNETWTGIGNQKQDWQVVSVFPNPSKGLLNIENPGRRIKRFQVLSVSGAVLMRQEKVETNTVSVDLSSLAPGLYFLQTEDGDGGLRIGNFVKE